MLRLIEGLVGVVFSGSRAITRFERATAEPLGNRRFRLVAGEHKPDPYWFEHRDPERELVCHTRLGRWSARYVADEPLTLEIWSDEFEAE